MEEKIKKERFYVGLIVAIVLILQIGLLWKLYMEAKVTRKCVQEIRDVVVPLQDAGLDLK
jgi:hypothetical protein